MAFHEVFLSITGIEHCWLTCSNHTLLPFVAFADAKKWCRHIFPAKVMGNYIRYPPQDNRDVLPATGPAGAAAKPPEASRAGLVGVKEQSQ
jgi:hypothetical protein